MLCEGWKVFGSGLQFTLGCLKFKILASHFKTGLSTRRYPSADFESISSLQDTASLSLSLSLPLQLSRILSSRIFFSAFLYRWISETLCVHETCVRALGLKVLASKFPFSLRKRDREGGRERERKTVDWCKAISLQKSRTYDWLGRVFSSVLKHFSSLHFFEEKNCDSFVWVITNSSGSGYC